MNTSSFATIEIISGNKDSHFMTSYILVLLLISYGLQSGHVTSINALQK